MNHEVKLNKNPNRDPLSGEPGAHPVGTGVGAAVGGAAAVAAAAGSAAGPVGTVIGGAVGAIVGGLAGTTVAENIDPTVESSYWHDNFKSRPYVTEDATYDDYGPAYDYGVDAAIEYEGKHFDDVESDLSRSWRKMSGRSELAWDRAREAARDAWNRVRNIV